MLLPTPRRHGRFWCHSITMLSSVLTSKVLGQFYINLLLTALENPPELHYSDITISLTVRSSNPRGRLLHATSNLFYFLLGNSYRFQIVIEHWFSSPEVHPFFHIITKLCYIRIGSKITQWCLHCHQPVTTTEFYRHTTPHIFFRRRRHGH